MLLRNFVFIQTDDPHLVAEIYYVAIDYTCRNEFCLTV
jgi:hypothetical protein